MKHFPHFLNFDPKKTGENMLTDPNNKCIISDIPEINMAIKDVFKDVLKHTHGLGIFEMVKITGLNRQDRNRNC